MPNVYHFTADNSIVIGLPWSKAITLPENLTGKTVQFILRVRFSETAFATYTSADRITVGTPGATTVVTIGLTAADTAAFTAQVVDYSLRIVNGEEYLTGTLSIKL